MSDGFTSANSTRRGKRRTKGHGGAAQLQQVIVQRAIAGTEERRSFLRQTTKYYLLPTLTRELPPFIRIVCLGLGRVHASPAAQFQLAVLLELRNERPVITYDPVFDQDDCLVLRAVELEPSDETEVHTPSSLFCYVSVVDQLIMVLDVVLTVVLFLSLIHSLFLFFWFGY